MHAGMNYAAVLDSAIDLARAMHHLHCNGVIHMDLKTGNVLLHSSRSEGRGVTCKVGRVDSSHHHLSKPARHS